MIRVLGLGLRLSSGFGEQRFGCAGLRLSVFVGSFSGCQLRYPFAAASSVNERFLTIFWHTTSTSISNPYAPLQFQP